MTTSDRCPQISVVVPVFNGRQTLPELCARVRKVCEAQGLSFEMILVDDGSSDGSWETIDHLCRGNEALRGIRLARNFGQTAATYCGLAAARGRIVVTMDDDLQHLPEDIPRLLAPMAENRDLEAVFGVPAAYEGGRYRRWLSAAFERLERRVTGRPAEIRVSSFRVLTRNVVDDLLSMGRHRAPVGLTVIRLTRHVLSVPVDHQPRRHGRSGYGWGALYGMALEHMLGVSLKPLRWLTFLGACGMGASLLLGAYYLLRFLFGRIGVPGWTTLVLLMILLLGFSSFAFGLMGEYLMRLLDASTNLPAYRVRAVAGRWPSESSRA
jgi:dolichol-phosphate mannosyltransferase/undecaprenyl-phosphate 4-deoxy-4-formamido-L-arabinose transferase